MARPRMFDEAEVLDSAMRMFWVKGYEATSTQDLCEATGLGRSSIYNTFSSKSDLFARALTRYLDRMAGRQATILDDEERPVADRIASLLDHAVEDEVRNASDGHAIGCFGVNATVELAGRDPEIARILARDAARRTANLRSALEAGRRDGSISPRRPPEALAHYLNAVVTGMRVSAQGGADRAALTAVAETALDVLTL